MSARPAEPDPARALAAIAAQARWEAADLRARKGPETARDLLRGHSAELAGSALAREQLLGLALDQAAQSFASGEVVPLVDLRGFLAPQALPSEALQPIRRRAAAIGRLRLADGLLPVDAELNERLWADPRLPADEAARAAMLAAVPRLRLAARQAVRAPWWRRLARAWR